MTAGSVSRRLPLLAGVALALCYLLTFPGTIAPHISDGRSMYMVTQALVDRLDVAIAPTDPREVAVAPGWRPLPLPAPSACTVERDVDGIGARPGGPYFSKYGIGQSLAAAPLYWLGVQVARLAQAAYRAEVAALVTSLFCPLVIACTAALLCALALRLGWSRRVSLVLALLYGLATPIWAYIATFFSEPAIGLCLLGALAAVLWADAGPPARAAVLAGCWLAAATLIRLDSVFYVLPFGAFVLVRGRRAGRIPRLSAFVVPVAGALAAIGAYNQARFGSPFRTGYGIIGDYHDLHPPHGLQALWEGIYGPLLSPGKGLFLYAPILLLLPWALPRFARISRGGSWLIAGVLAVAVLAHANTLVVWLGGWAWGPRFLIPTLPVLILPLGAVLDGAGARLRALVWLLGLIGLAIQVPAVLLDKGVYIRHLQNATPGNCIWRAEDLYKWHPEYSPLIGQWQRLLDGNTYVAPLRSDTTPQAVGVRGRLVPVPQTWWELLALQGVSHGALALAAGIIGAMALLALWASLRAATPPRALAPPGEQYRAPPQRVVVRY